MKIEDLLNKKSYWGQHTYIMRKDDDKYCLEIYRNVPKIHEASVYLTDLDDMEREFYNERSVLSLLAGNRWVLRFAEFLHSFKYNAD